ncbi:MAG: AAA family ATPase [Gammaproteobacteria bacterium RIFCSPHIGHO2_12_FULL_45_9]|nr:MAG: AAA family ATPase [Gammaproteobacteria bacterium RIFCSPHIGHO2_12_FULL_45_9]
MIQRHIAAYLLKAATEYPVVALTGPRQSGKTTLVEHLFANKRYVSLEDPDNRAFARQDPRAFLKQYQGGGIIDEAQYVPDLFSYIQTHVDKSKQPGEFILTGSQNFLLLENISQSLAGRVAIAHLLPLTYTELSGTLTQEMDIFTLLFKGLYPRMYDFSLDPTDWYKNYVTTYLERDVRQIKQVSDLSKFQLFIRLCAGRIGQLLNMASLATDCGIDHATLKAWLSILEASFLIFLLRPHHKNFNKRLVKQPKLYFCDTGLAAYLLGIERPEQLLTHYAKGALFENFVVMELIKKRFNQGKEHQLYFWRDNHGHEIDILLSRGEELIPIEVKSSQTITSDFLKGLGYWQDLTHNQEAYLVYAGDINQRRTQATCLSWKALSEIGY